MANYRVKVIGHLCKNNHLAKFGDIIDERQLTSTPIELIEKGFIEPYLEDKEEEFNLDTLTKKELVQFAKDNGFLINENASRLIVLSEIDAQLKDKEVNGSITVE